MVQPGRLITMGQLFTVSPEPHSLHHLLLVDDLHSDPHQHDEDLLSGSLSSLNLQLLHWSTHPIQSRAWQRPLSSCSSLTTSTWLVQRGLLPTMSKKTSPSGLDFLTVGDFSGPPLAHGDPAPLGPKECKLKGEELVSYQFICMCWSKSQSISRVLMLMPRLFECN